MALVDDKVYYTVQYLKHLGPVKDIQIGRTNRAFENIPK